MGEGKSYGIWLVVGRVSHVAVGEVQLRRLKRWWTLWSTFTRDPVNTLISLKFKLTWQFVLFTWRFHCPVNIEQLFLIMRWCFWWWKEQWSSYWRYLFWKDFLKIQVHLFFGCLGICIYCIDSVTNVTFYLKSDSHLPKNIVLFSSLKAL